MPSLRRGIWVLSFCALALAAGTISGPSVAAPVSVETAANACTITQSKSLQGTVRTDIRFVNKTSGAVKIYWLDYTGKRVFYKTLAAGASYLQPTWVTHPWVAIDAAGSVHRVCDRAEGRVRDHRRRRRGRRAAACEEADVHGSRLHDRRQRAGLDVHRAGRRRWHRAVDAALGQRLVLGVKRLRRIVVHARRDAGLPRDRELHSLLHCRRRTWFRGSRLR